MRYLKRKVVLPYLYEQLTGNFAGFLIGMSATGLVSQFFETRSFRNLWGLTSKKTAIDKATFSNLEWIISIVIGFIVFEIMTKVVKERLDRNLPTIKRKLFRFLIYLGLHQVARQGYHTFQIRSIQYISAMGAGMRQAFSLFSRR